MQGAVSGLAGVGLEGEVPRAVIGRERLQALVLHQVLRLGHTVQAAAAVGDSAVRVVRRLGAFARVYCPRVRADVVELHIPDHALGTVLSPDVVVAVDAGQSRSVRDPHAADAIASLGDGDGGTVGPVAFVKWNYRIVVWVG